MPTAGAFDAWRRDLLQRLRQASFAAWPSKAPDTKVANLGDRPAEGRESTEEGIEVFWRWLPGKDRTVSPWLIVLNPGDEEGKVPPWAHDLVGAASVLLLCPRGVGPVAWTRDVFPNAVERSFPLVGATSDSGRVWDVKTIARRHAPARGGWRTAGRGQAGIVAAYSALFEPVIEEVWAIEPPPSHMPELPGGQYAPPLLNVLRVLNVPEALGCLAPRRLVLAGTASRAVRPHGRPLSSGRGG